MSPHTHTHLCDLHSEPLVDTYLGKGYVLRSDYEFKKAALRG